jgi:hypothetical protein
MRSGMQGFVSAKKPPNLSKSERAGRPARAPRRQNDTLTPTVMLRPISGAAFLMNEVWA